MAGVDGDSGGFGHTSAVCAQSSARLDAFVRCFDAQKAPPVRAATSSLVSHPPTALLAALSDLRRAGQPFDDAWPSALAVALANDAGEWRLALEERDAWRSAYERTPRRRRERALAVVGSDPEREPLEPVTDDGERAWDPPARGVGEPGARGVGEPGLT